MISSTICTAGPTGSAESHEEEIEMAMKREDVQYWTKVQCETEMKNRLGRVEEIRARNGGTLANITDQDDMITVRDLHAEINVIGERLDAILAAEKADHDAARWSDRLSNPVNPIAHPTSGRRDEVVEGMGTLFTASDAYRRYVDQGIHDMVCKMPTKAFLNAVFRTGAGIATESVRIPELLQRMPVRPAPFVTQFFPIRITEQAAIKYLEQTTRTNNAAEFAEATADADTDILGESAIAYTDRTREVVPIGTWLPVTEQQIKFQPEAEQEINEELPQMVLERLDLQALQGNGTSPNLLGTNNVTGIQTQNKGADPTFDAVFKLLRKIRDDGFAEPDVIFITPADWETIRLTRTADGIYILGNPSEPGPERLWGVQVAQTTAQAANTITAGAYGRYSRLYMGGTMEVSVTNSHRRHFTRLMLAVRAVVYASVVHLRPKAFGTVNLAA